ncbi:MAG: C-type lectin domain-containing protein [Clostridia bacterium]|nr:C-type lectin domain-containing protein [Clostridia bacterium]
MKKIFILLIVLSTCIACFTSCKLINSIFNCKHKETITDAAVAPTCTESGLTEGSHCAKCGEVVLAQEVVSALGHTNVIDDSVPPTCTNSGLTSGVHCSVCNTTIVAQETVPLSHTYGEWEIISEGDCFTPGEKKRVCFECSEEEIEKSEANNHSFVQNEETKLFYCELCNATIYAGHLYAAFDEELVWYDAYNKCKAMGGYLVTITSQGEQDVIDQIIESRVIPEGAGQEYYYWNGLIRNTDGWHWITGEDVVFTNWSSKEPDDDGSAQWIVGMAKRVASANSHAKLGQWEDSNQNARDPFICEWELDIEESEHFFTEWMTATEVSCYGDGEERRLCTHCGLEETRDVDQLDHSFVFNEANGITSCEYCNAGLYNGHIYKIIEIKSSWFDAYTYCNSLGGHLVTITSENEQTYLNTFMNANSYTAKTWIGGFNDANGFKWVTGEEFEYGSWQKGQPNNADSADWYIMMNTTFGQWNDYPPLEKAYFICEWDAE